MLLGERIKVEYRNLVWEDQIRTSSVRKGINGTTFGIQCTKGANIVNIGIGIIVSV